MVTVLAGIDPGLHGALAVLNEAGDCETILMPIMGKPPIIDGGAIVRWFAERDVELAIVEQQQSMPQQSCVATHRAGQAYGQILGVLQACCIPYKLVQPKRWKSQLSLYTDRREGESVARRLRRMKEESRRRAIELLPRARDQFNLHKDEARAEAALIAWWYMQEVRGRSKETVAHF